ncbi:MAG: hypothetical protein Q4G26_00985 [Paracoccus sp. (in: a-proteobacteria)]|nr:hypothetical protein [Paracoccus sp. (in: a-proteobacteria)]
MSALLQFEDFAAPRHAPAPSYCAADLAAEYQRGRAEGMQAGREASLDELAAILRDMMAEATDQAAIRASAVTETLTATQPVLQALAAQLAELPCDRLIDHVLAELSRLCLAGIAPTCQIAGAPGQIDKLASRIDAMGLAGVTLLPGPQTEIRFGGGHIAFAPDEITTQISAILAEIQAGTED